MYRALKYRAPKSGALMYMALIGDADCTSMGLLVQFFSMMPTLEFVSDSRLAKVKLALVSLEGLHWELARDLVAPQSLFDEMMAQARQSAAGASRPANGEASMAMSNAASGAKVVERRTHAVRDMLRNGSYKPAGRAKPSSEYLLAAALEGDFPQVNPFVNAVNLASLKYLYPMSIFDADKAGGALVCRLGAAGESYVFNSSGQTIDLEDLLCVCAKEPVRDLDVSAMGPAELGIPIVNPVRDSMATKLFEGAHNAIVIIYAPSGTEGADLEHAAADIAAWCGPACESTDIRIFDTEAKKAERKII